MSAEEHVVRFVQGEASWRVSVPTGASLLEAARACGAPVQTLCHGIGACVQCRVKVIEGREHLNLPTALEKDRVGNTFHLTGERMGCQACVQGPVLVEVLEARLPKRSRVRRRR